MQHSVPPRLPASATSACHSPSRPLNSDTALPTPNRITRKQIPRLALRQRNRLPHAQRLVYIQSDFRVLHGGEHMVAPPPMPEPTPEATGEVADAVGGNWVDRFAPTRSRPYLRLSRADRPIGTWLLLLPCWWGLLLASAATGRLGLFDAWIAVGCALGAFLMRGAGCTWNDITDRDIDASVTRTRSRPIPSGQVSVRGALIWMALQALIALAILLTFPPAAILLGFASLVLVAIYPFAKRFTWWPQVFLGPRFQLGRAIGLGGTYRQPRPASGDPLRWWHRLDAVLRHDLRPSGH